MTWDMLARDLRHALRGLLRAPMFTIVAVATLAIGIGATTAVFSVVDGVLLKPLPYPESDELVAVWHDAPGAPGLTAVAGGLQLSPSMLVTFQDENRSFEQIGLWTVQTVNVTGVAEPEQVAAAAVTSQALDAFGVPPLLGRWIGARGRGSDQPGRDLLSYAYWQERFGGDPDIVGKRIEVNNTGAEIVGVMPRGFRLGDTAADLIGPFRMNRAQLIPPPFCCNGIARLREGVTLAQANADVERMLPLWIERFPFPRADGPTAKEVYLDTWRITPTLRPFKDDVLGGVSDVLWVVMAMIGIVLLIASANVANLLLVRGEGRALELAVRAALGAGTWRIARSLLVEQRTARGARRHRRSGRRVWSLASVARARAATAAAARRDLARRARARLRVARDGGRRCSIQRRTALAGGAHAACDAPARLARRELGCRAAPHAERARRRPGRARARAARELRPHDSHASRRCAPSSPASRDPSRCKRSASPCRRSSCRIAEGVWRAHQRHRRRRSRAIPGVESVGFHERTADGAGRHELGRHPGRGPRQQPGLDGAARFQFDLSRAISRTMGTSVVAGRDLTFERRRRYASCGARLRVAGARALVVAGSGGGAADPWRR